MYSPAYQNSWDTTTLGTFTFTNTGPIVIKSHLQSVVRASRLFFNQMDGQAQAESVC